MGHLGDNRQNGASMAMEAFVPGDNATEELVWLDGHSSREAGHLDLYVKYAHLFKRLSQTYKLPGPKKFCWESRSGPAALAGGLCEALAVRPHS